MVKNPPVSAGAVGGAISIPGQPHSSVLSKIILWTEELGDLQSMGSQRIRQK